MTVDELNLINSYKNKNKDLLSVKRDNFSLQKTYKKVERVYSTEEQTKFSKYNFHIEINQFGIKVNNPQTNKYLESDFVYKINKKHARSLYRSEGPLHEKAEDLTFPRNRLQKFKLIDDYYQETNKDMFNQIYQELAENYNEVSVPQQKRRDQRRTTCVSINNINSIINNSNNNNNLNSSFDNAQQRRSIISLKENTIYMSPNKIKQKYAYNSSSVDNKNQGKHKNNNTSNIEKKVFEKPALKNFNTSIKVNHYRLQSHNILEKLNEYNKSNSERVFLKADDLKTSKTKNFIENKKELIKLLEKNNQKEEVMCDRKLHYFYKTNRDLNDEKLFLQLSLGKITPEEVINKCKSRDLRDFCETNLKNDRNDKYHSNSNKMKSTLTFKYDKYSPKQNILSTNEKENLASIRSQNSNRDYLSTDNENNRSTISKNYMNSNTNNMNNMYNVNTNNTNKTDYSHINKAELDNFKLKSLKNDNFDTFRERKDSGNNLNFKNQLNSKSNNYLTGNFNNISNNNSNDAYNIYNVNYGKTTSNYNNISMAKSSSTDYYGKSGVIGTSGISQSAKLNIPSYERTDKKEAEKIYSCNPIPVKNLNFSSIQNSVIRKVGYL